jgi:hypothetical protein
MKVDARDTGQLHGGAHKDRDARRQRRQHRFKGTVRGVVEEQRPDGMLAIPDDAGDHQAPFRDEQPA